MAKGRLATIGTRALVASLVMCMSLMMVPATAFAEIGGVAYEVEVDASQDDAINTLGLENGDIKEVGDHETLMELDGKYAALYNSQFA